MTDEEFLRKAGIAHEDIHRGTIYCSKRSADSAWACAEFWRDMAGIWKRRHESVCRALAAASAALALTVILLVWSLSR